MKNKKLSLQLKPILKGEDSKKIEKKISEDQTELFKKAKKATKKVEFQEDKIKVYVVIGCGHTYHAVFRTKKEAKKYIKDRKPINVEYYEILKEKI